MSPTPSDLPLRNITYGKSFSQLDREPRRQQEGSSPICDNSSTYTSVQDYPPLKSLSVPLSIAVSGLLCYESRINIPKNPTVISFNTESKESEMTVAIRIRYDPKDEEHCPTLTPQSNFNLRTDQFCNGGSASLFGEFLTSEALGE